LDRVFPDQVREADRDQGEDEVTAGAWEEAGLLLGM